MAIAELDRIAELASVRGIELSELVDVLEGSACGIDLTVA